MQEQNVGIIKRLGFNITIVRTLAVVVMVLCALFLLLPNQRDSLQFATAILGGAALIYAAFCAGETLQTQITRDKQSKSFQFLDHLNRKEATDVRVFIENEVDNKELSRAELYRKVRNDMSLLSAVMIMLGIFEGNCSGSLTYSSGAVG